MSYCVVCGIITHPNMMGEIKMPVSYDKLWKTLIDKKMKRSDLKDAAGISFNVLAKMGKNGRTTNYAVVHNGRISISLSTKNTK